MSRGAQRTEIVTLKPELLDLDTQYESMLPCEAAPSTDPHVVMSAKGAHLSLRKAVEAVQRQAIRQALGLK